MRLSREAVKSQVTGGAEQRDVAWLSLLDVKVMSTRAFSLTFP